MSETWTMAQAAMIIEKPPEVLQKTVERATVKPSLARRAGRQVYVFGMRDLVFYRALDDLKEGLTIRKVFEVYSILKEMPDGAAIGSVEVGHLKYDFKPYVRLVKARVEETEKLLKLIDASGPEPVIRGTGINAYRIAALGDGMSVAEILEDYPALTERQVQAAKAYAESSPKAGRPYPKSTAKRAMREARADADPYLPTRR